MDNPDIYVFLNDYINSQTKLQLLFRGEFSLLKKKALILTQSNKKTQPNEVPNTEIYSNMNLQALQV